MMVFTEAESCNERGSSANEDGGAHRTPDQLSRLE